MPRKKLNEHNQQLPIIFNLYLRQPLQDEHYRSHSFFYWFLTTPRRIQPFVFIASVETYTPPYFLLVEVPGTAPGSKTSIPQRVQNHRHFRDRLIIIFYTGNCKFLSYNADYEVPG